MAENNEMEMYATQRSTVSVRSEFLQAAAMRRE